MMSDTAGRAVLKLVKQEAELSQEVIEVLQEQLEISLSDGLQSLRNVPPPPANNS
jgi:hypothetical protein